MGANEFRKFLIIRLFNKPMATGYAFGTMAKGRNSSGLATLVKWFFILSGIMTSLVVIAGIVYKIIN